MLRRIVLAMRMLFAGFAGFAMCGAVVHAQQPVQSHSVSLKWTASTDSVSGYNIYRLTGACPATGASGFAKITLTPVTGTSYTDASIAAGTYCYYATAVLNAAESVPSNFATAVILPATPSGLSVSGAN